MKRRFQFGLLLICALLPSLAAAQQNDAAAAKQEIKQMLGFVPGFLDQVPDVALPGAWEEFKSMQLNPNTALSGRVKELIGLAVAAQVPCRYCTYAHTEFAQLGGADKAQIGEAVIMASLTRHWSTVLQGQQTDYAAFRAMLKQAMQHMQKQAAAGAQPKPMPPSSDPYEQALREIAQVFGSVPEFFTKLPREALPGAWREMRDVEMNPQTKLSGKEKCLIGLAVASQIPCRFCIAADTEFAKAEGATDREIAEAIAMAALTRHWSTYLNGMQIDEPAFRRDIDRLVKGAKKQAAAAKAQTAQIEAKPEPAALIAQR